MVEELMKLLIFSSTKSSCEKILVNVARVALFFASIYTHLSLSLQTGYFKNIQFYEY